MRPLALTSQLLKRLLDPADPALRARVLVDLLDRADDDPEVQGAQGRLTDQRWVRSTLRAHRGDGTWGRGFYHKYDGTSWVLLHLSEIGVPAHLPPVAAGVDRLLETARSVADLKGERGRPFRDLPGGVYWQYPIPCLTAHMALVLVRAGLASHPVTRGALSACRHPFQEGLGFGCYVMEGSLLPACIMTVPKVLKAHLALPPAERSEEEVRAIEEMIRLLKAFHLYRYVPESSAAWREWASKATPAERREAKPRWIAGGCLEPRRPKAGWLRFSFPHTYNSDLLEVLLLLGEAGERPDDVIAEGLGKVLERRGPEGMWKMEGGLNGRMHGRLDREGQSSRWITYRALLAFKRFGLLEPSPECD